MTHLSLWRATRLLSASLVLAALFTVAATGVVAQEGMPQASPQPQTETQTPPPAQQQAAEAAAPADAPLYGEFKGVKIGTSRDEARKLLGSPQQKDAAQDFFLFSDRERARIYYDEKGAVSAVIVTYVGKSAGAPTPQAILGSEVEAKQDGSMYKMVQYPKAGYWVAYSRTTGDEPLTIITMQKSNAQ
jgi:hypothetical protein